MKVAPFDATAWRVDHPLGTVAFNHLIAGGEAETPDDYRHVLGRQVADFHAVDAAWREPEGGKGPAAEVPAPALQESHHR